MTNKQLGRLFDTGPRHGWNPDRGEVVAVYIGGGPGGFRFEVGTVVERFETAHYSGNPIISYRVDLEKGGWLQCSRNNLRPL